jgi:hypothetical protein
VVLVRRNSDTLQGICPAVVERDVSRKVDWTSRDEWMAFSVAGSNPGVLKILQQDFKQV